MEHLELLKTLIVSADRMRSLQRHYFGAVREHVDNEQKRFILAQAKAAESEFDKTLFTIKQLIQ